MIFSRAGEAFYRFAEMTAMQLRSALAGRTDECHCKTRLKCQRDQCGFTKTRNAFDADVFGVNGQIRFEIIKPTREANPSRRVCAVDLCCTVR